MRNNQDPCDPRLRSPVLPRDDTLFSPASGCLYKCPAVWRGDVGQRDALATPTIAHFRPSPVSIVFPGTWPNTVVCRYASKVDSAVQNPDHVTPTGCRRSSAARQILVQRLLQAVPGVFLHKAHWLSLFHMFSYGSVGGLKPPAFVTLRKLHAVGANDGASLRRMYKKDLRNGLTLLTNADTLNK